MYKYPCNFHVKSLHTWTAMWCTLKEFILVDVVTLLHKYEVIWHGNYMGIHTNASTSTRINSSSVHIYVHLCFITTHLIFNRVHHCTKVQGLNSKIKYPFQSNAFRLNVSMMHPTTNVPSIHICCWKSKLFIPNTNGSQKDIQIEVLFKWLSNWKFFQNFELLLNNAMLDSSKNARIFFLFWINRVQPAIVNPVVYYRCQSGCDGQGQGLYRAFYDLISGGSKGGKFKKKTYPWPLLVIWPAQKFLNFMRFFWKIWQNHMLAPPSTGIPGSAPGNDQYWRFKGKDHCNSKHFNRNTNK